MKKYFSIALLLYLLGVSLQARSDFEKSGDVMRFAPLGALVFSLIKKDYEGSAQLILGTLATQGSVELIKAGFDYAHRSGLNYELAKRPCCNEYKGMPSGHAAGAMSAAGYMYFRYGWKESLIFTGIGIVTAASRVYANKHSILQVVSGSLIAWSWAYLMTTPYQQRLKMQPDVGFDEKGNTYYGMNLSIVW